MISPEEQRELLLRAREAITAALSGVEPRRRPAHYPVLDRRCGLFVTLKQSGELRGCIGHIESVRPLGELVGEVAVMAAMEDPRFFPLTLAELPAVNLQLSVLSPLRRIQGERDIVIGTHGLLMERSGLRGLLLPQVAVEYGWDVAQFLEATARKTGLPGDAWRESATKLFVFTAEIIDEAEVIHGSAQGHPAV